MAALSVSGLSRSACDYSVREPNENYGNTYGNDFGAQRLESLCAFFGSVTGNSPNVEFASRLWVFEQRLDNRATLLAGGTEDNNDLLEHDVPGAFDWRYLGRLSWCFRGIF
jgi:hypothetical protein